MSENVLTRYRPRAKAYAAAEKHRGLARVIVLASRFSPEHGAIAESVARYARILDTAADESPLIRPVIAALEVEREALLIRQPTELQRDYVYPALSAYSSEKRQAILTQVGRLISGILIDANLRLTGAVPSPMLLRHRNTITFLSALNCFALGWTDRYFRPLPIVYDLIHAFASYDNAVDTSEDLSHGLILISKPEAERFRLQFYPGQPVNIRNIQRYFKWKKLQLLMDFCRYSRAIFVTGLPIWMDIPSFIYLWARMSRLVRHRGWQEIIYNPPHDSLCWKTL